MKFVDQITSGKFQPFQSQYVDQERPCIIKAVAAEWPALKNWTPENLSNRYGEVLLPISNYAGQGNSKMSEKARMCLRDYMEFIQRAAMGGVEAQQPIYAAGWHYLKDCPALAVDLRRPQEFDDNWIDRLQGIINFDQTSLFIGHPAAETPLHTDSFFVSTWLVMIKGSKQIRLIPARYTGFVKNGLDTFSEPIRTELESRQIPVFEATISQGDALYIPPGWWHQVRNLEVTIAISNNYVGKSQFLAFEQQLRAKLLKPILGLSKLRESATLQGVRVGPEISVSSRYVQNERAYIDFLRSEVDNLVRVTSEVEAIC